MKFFITLVCCSLFAISMLHSTLADESSGLSCAIGTKGNLSCLLSCNLQGCDTGNCNANDACACSGCKASVPENSADCAPSCSAECTRRHCWVFVCTDNYCDCLNCFAEESSLHIGTIYNTTSTHPKSISSNKIVV